MKVFHYTKLSNWDGIKDGNWKNEYIPGLAADKRLGNLYKPAREIGAIFGLLEPKPSDWIHNVYFRNVWDELQQKTGSLLLQIDIKPNDPNVFVVEGGHIVANWNSRQEDSNIPNHLLHLTDMEKEEAYYRSMVSLGSYLKDQRRHNYILPEVIITRNIPLGDIRICNQQPFLAEKIPHFSTQEGRQLLKILESTPELHQWKNEHKNEIAELIYKLGKNQNKESDNIRY